MDVYLVLDNDGNAKVVKTPPAERKLNEAVYEVAITIGGQQPFVLGVTHMPVDVKAADLKAAGVDPDQPSVPSVAQAEPTPDPKPGETGV